MWLWFSAGNQWDQSHRIKCLANMLDYEYIHKLSRSSEALSGILKFSAPPRRKGTWVTKSICRSSIFSRVPSEKYVLTSLIHY